MDTPQLTLSYHNEELSLSSGDDTTKQSQTETTGASKEVSTHAALMSLSGLPKELRLMIYAYILGDLPKIKHREIPVPDAGGPFLSLGAPSRKVTCLFLTGYHRGRIWISRRPFFIDRAPAKINGELAEELIRTNTNTIRFLGDSTLMREWLNPVSTTTIKKIDAFSFIGVLDAKTLLPLVETVKLFRSAGNIGALRINLFFQTEDKQPHEVPKDVVDSIVNAQPDAFSDSTEAWYDWLNGTLEELNSYRCDTCRFCTSWCTSHIDFDIESDDEDMMRSAKQRRSNPSTAQGINGEVSTQHSRDGEDDDNCLETGEDSADPYNASMSDGGFTSDEDDYSDLDHDQ